jgi:hypothetical protein
MLRLLAVALVVMVAAQMVTAQQPVIKGDQAAGQELFAAMGKLGNSKTYRMKLFVPPSAQGAGRMSLITERVNPDRMRTVMDMPDLWTMELIGVGQEYRRRITLKGELAKMVEQQQQQMLNQMMSGGIFGLIGAILNPVGALINVAMNAIAQKMAERATNQFRNGVWACMTVPGQSSSSSPSQSSSTEITVARAGESTVEGDRTQAYDLIIVSQEGGKTTTTKARMHVLTDRQVPRRMESFDDKGTLQGGMDFYDVDAPITIDLPACQ